ncbi:MAG: hypothetical protein ACRCUE_04020 [Bosea sp. (in: a-proteobacteria)]
MIDITDLRSTIVPKSDQLNSEQLLGGPMTITVTDVRTGSGEDQPVSIHYENDNGRPFKPCKTMRKVLILAWGHDARNWVGQSMVLFNDPSVKFGGMDVGGIRISHMTGIPKTIHVNLTATKGKKAPHTIQAMTVDKPAVPADWPDKSFALQLPRWAKAVGSGIKTVADIMEMAQKKGGLTDEQRAQIEALRSGDAT